MENRGMVKWQPFAALNGQGKVLKNMKEMKYARPKPELSEDQVIEINDKLISAYESGENVRISYFKKGYFDYEYSTIRKIDKSRKIVLLSNGTKIPLTMIYDIKYM